MELRTTTNYHLVGYSYAFFWWGIFTLYCIGYQASRLRVFWSRRQRVHGQVKEKELYMSTPTLWKRAIQWLDHLVRIPHVTEMIPVKHILGVSLFVIINAIWILFAPFSIQEGFNYILPAVGVFDRRSAFVGLVNWSFVFVLATRNSILYHMSGLSYEQLLPFHRWLARIGGLEFITHIVWRIIHGYQKTYIAKDALFYDTEQTTGTIATIAFLLMFVTSVEYIRRHHFEVFYYSHIIGAVVAIIFSCWHEVMCFVYFMPAVILWVADRAWRSYQSWIVKATPIQIDEFCPPTAQNEGITRIMFEHRDLQNYRAGQYVFIAMAKNKGGFYWHKFANWHPLTISEVFHVNANQLHLISDASSETIEERIVSDQAEKAVEKKVKSPDSLLNLDLSDTTSLRRRAVACAVHAADDKRTVLASLHIKSLGQYTQRLLEFAAAKEELVVKVDGPYGPQMDYQDHKIVACFATGIGITPALSLIKDCVERRASGVQTTATEKVYLFWIVRSADEVAPFIDMVSYWAEKCGGATLPIQLDIQIHVTRAMSGPDLLSSCATEKGDSRYQMTYGGRPNLNEFTERVTESNVWLHACGSVAFMKEVLNKAAKKGWKAHNETFEF